MSFLDVSCPVPPDPPQPPVYYYYSGILCGGSIVEEFRSTDPSLGDHCGVVYAYCDACGGTNQCFDNISPGAPVNSNDVITCHTDCSSCAGVNLYFVGIKPYISGSGDGKFNISGVRALSIYTSDSTNVVTNVTADVTMTNSITYTLTIPTGNSSSTPVAIASGTASIASMTVTSPYGPYHYDSNNDYYYFADF